MDTPDSSECPRLLIAEDHSAIAWDMATTAEDAGWEVVGPVSRAADALRLIKAERVDAAVLDYHLTDGTADPIADVLVRRGVPFVIVTTYDLSEYVISAPSVAIVIQKPYAPEQLLEVLRLLQRERWTTVN
ncbi:MAG: response regulator [Alphaproteobacteria bacterium]|nr:response regulator [Alphaproteobacteria bacterium]